MIVISFSLLLEAKLTFFSLFILFLFVQELAEDVLMTPEQGDERTRFLAAAGRSCIGSIA
jgi:hypothetical protein